MRAWWTLVRREMGTYFISWTGYVIIGVVVFLLGLCFSLLLEAINGERQEMPVLELFQSSYYFWLILLLASPVITMRSFAHEKFTGTFETLMTTPVSDLQVVLAKFASAMIFYLLTWMPLFGCVLVVRHFSNEPGALDAGTISSTYLGIALLGGLYMSIGCFASSLTRSQIIAAMFSLAMGITLFLLSFLSRVLAAQSGWVSKLFAHFSMTEHMGDFSRGVVDLRSLVFYLSLTSLFLFLTLKAVESRRWKS
ncbi:MAG TPA: ABC transporter permease [Methylomirabilota bacterium]|nr:ABC transporter permease [Methylomirabilota bacterium]